MKQEQLIGKRYGRLKVVDYGKHYVSPKNGRKFAQWKCRCDCGNILLIKADALKSGNTTSCSCKRYETCAKICIERSTHGMTNHKLYKTWRGIIRRTTYSNNSDFKHYGGRGISVCEEWKHDLVGFIDYVESLPGCYVDGNELDRIDNEGNYEPGNLRWVTHQVQVSNTRRNIKLEFNGKQYKTLVDACSDLNIPYARALSRLRKGMDLKTVFHKYHLQQSPIAIPI